MTADFVCRSNTFTGNNATREGGAIASVNNLHRHALFMGNVTATNNHAVTGGAVYGTDDASIMIGNGSTFDGNTASANGGALACVECGSLTLLGGSMTSNQANLSGGALYTEASMALQLEDVQYTGNWYAPILSLGVSKAAHAITRSDFHVKQNKLKLSSQHNSPFLDILGQCTASLVF